MRIKVPFTRGKYIDFPQLLFGWVTMFLILVMPFVSSPFIKVITFVREKIGAFFGQDYTSAK